MKDKMTITPRAAAVLPIRTELPDELQTATKPWYVASTGNHQGLVIEEGTGRNIAVTYDKADAPLIASAPAQAAEIAKLRAALAEIAERGPIEGYTSAGALRLRLVATQCIARAALAVSGIGGPLGVKIEVSGGCAEVTECPESVRVTIIDHDNERDTI